VGQAAHDRRSGGGNLGLTTITMPRTNPPFRADHVGSLLRPAALKAARVQRAAGAITADALKAIEDREIEKIIAKQQEIGLRSATDGEFRRSWWHLDFLAGLVGTELIDLEAGIQFEGVRTRAQGVRVSGKLDFRGHPMLDHFAFLKAHTGCTPKMTIPAPSAMYARGGRALVSEAAYPSLDSFFEDLGRAYRKAVRAFADAGCRYLQLDEVYVAMLCDPAHCKMLVERGDDPKRLLKTYGDLINAAISDIPPDMTITMHLCRGNFRSTYQGSGGYEPVADALFNQIKVHGYFMEYDSDRAGSFEPLRYVPAGKSIVLGLVTSKTGQLESREQIKRRIEEAAKFVDLDRLCLSPQCGFASTEEGNTLAEDEQWAKLRMIVEVAQEVWRK
jgi:5-methyltetrahydropteroyltriglutamate--homocysteine methyltransferase